MNFGRWSIGLAGGALVAAAALVAPAIDAMEKHQPVRSTQRPAPRGIGNFTPAAGDPRLAALLSRGGFDSSGLRFTPADARRDQRAVTVAVRARTARGTTGRATEVASDVTTGIAPIAYNLGVSVGWKRLALASEVTRVDMATQPGSRESADLALSYTAPRWSGRVKAEADRPTAGAPRLLTDRAGYSVDLGGSYSLTRNLDVTAGVRYRADRDRLTQIDDRRESQAVYVGTAFRF